MVASSSNKTLSNFLKSASLNIVGMIGLSAYILADTFYIARGMGEDGLAALNFAIPVYSILQGIGLMIGMGGAIRYAISQNADDHRRKTVFTESLTFGLCISVLFLVAGVFFSGSIVSLFGATGRVLALSSEYLTTILCFAPLFIVNNIVICFVRNDGNPRLAMLGMIIGSLSNILLDWVFIFPMGMGMFGAAFATGLSPAISLVVLSRHFVKKRNNFTLVKTKLHRHALTDIMALGSGSLVLELASGIAMITFNAVIVRISGNLGVAAYGIVANLSLVLLSMFTGLSQGVQPLLSGAHGGDRRDEKKLLYRYAIVSAAVLSIVLYAVSFITAPMLVGLFNKDNNPQLAAMAVEGIKIYFAGLFFAAVNIVNLSYCSATEQPVRALTISLLRGAVLLVPAVLLLSAAFSQTGVWLSFPVCEACVFALSLLPALRSLVRKGKPIR